MDTCASACSLAHGVQDISAGGLERGSTDAPESLQALEELNRILAAPSLMLASLKQQQAGVNTALWELEQSLTRSRAAMTSVARGVLRTQEEGMPPQDPAKPDEASAGVPHTGSSEEIPTLMNRRSTQEALEEVYDMQSETEMNSHGLLEKIRKNRRPSIKPLPPMREDILMFIHLACKKLINTYFFECAISLVIVANSALIGVESQLATHGESVEWADLAEIGFMGTYILELIVRAIALRWSALRDGWFLFDFGLVMIAILEQVLSVTVAGSAGQQIMILRLLRLFRLVRTFRMIKQIRSIWRLVYGLMNSSETMISAFALLGLVLYVFGVLALQVISADPGLQSDPETQILIEHRFSSLGMTMMTLTQFVTVDSIASVYLPLIRQNPWLMFYFIPLILVVSISLMNLVTASLVEAALEHARQEKEEERKLANVAAKNMLPDIVKLFDQLDTDRSGFLVIQEMKDFETEGLVPPELLDKASVESMSELFQQLDVDESGRVNREEFIEGLLDIFLREVPVFAIQATKMLRLVRESQLKVEADMRSLQDQLGTKTNERSLGFF